jgi:hypothetical protein
VLLHDVHSICLFKSSQSEDSHMTACAGCVVGCPSYTHCVCECASGLPAAVVLLKIWCVGTSGSAASSVNARSTGCRWTAGYLQSHNTMPAVVCLLTQIDRLDVIRRERRAAALQVVKQLQRASLPTTMFRACASALCETG